MITYRTGTGEIRFPAWWFSYFWCFFDWSKWSTFGDSRNYLWHAWKGWPEKGVERHTIDSLLWVLSSWSLVLGQSVHHWCLVLPRTTTVAWKKIIWRQRTSLYFVYSKEIDIYKRTFSRSWRRAFQWMELCPWQRLFCLNWVYRKNLRFLIKFYELETLLNCWIWSKFSLKTSQCRHVSQHTPLTKSLTYILPYACNQYETNCYKSNHFEKLFSFYSVVNIILQSDRHVYIVHGAVFDTILIEL